MALPQLTEALAAFAAEREWDQFHSPKNFAMALLVEAGELMDPLQWCGHEESRQLVKNPEVKEYLAKEVGDVLMCLLQFARWCDIDAEAAAWSKLEELKQRYDPAKVGGDKYARVQASTGQPMFKTVSGAHQLKKKDA